MYCTKCNINWSCLASQEENDEVYEVCPVCKNDMDLVENITGDKYYFCPFTGQVINARTQQPLVQETSTAVLPSLKPVKNPIVSREQWEQKQLLREKREDAALDVYHNAYQDAMDRGASHEEAIEAGSIAYYTVSKIR